MTCPSCNNQLQQIDVQSDISGRFTVDHCGRCGGTWFDPYEVNRIPYHEVVRLAHLSVWRNKSVRQAEHPMHCPRDSHLLEPFRSDSLPSGVHFLRCKYCFGLWATQRALEDFKKKQETEKTVENSEKTRNSVFPALSVVFVPAALIFLLLFSTFVTILHLSSQRDSRIQALSFIQNLEILSAVPSGIVVSFETGKPLRTQITYGESILTQQTAWISVAPLTNHSIILTDLKPNTTYTYTLTLEDESGASFTTPQKSFGSGE